MNYVFEWVIELRVCIWSDTCDADISGSTTSGAVETLVIQILVVQPQVVQLRHLLYSLHVKQRSYMVSVLTINWYHYLFDPHH